jgi:hypothetical protein
MPSSVDTRGRSADGARELETGTTTNSSRSTPATISSTDSTIAGHGGHGGDQRLGVGVEHSFDPVVDALGRMRLREAAREMNHFANTGSPSANGPRPYATFSARST